MMAPIRTTYAAPEIDRREVLRYARCREETPEIAALLDKAIALSEGVLSYRVSFHEFPLAITGDLCDLGFVQLPSKSLAAHFAGCERVIAFAATVGLPYDRLIARHSHISPALATMLQALGTERVEALCDAFCADIAQKADKEGFLTTTRFSPGYGDLPLSMQRELFLALDCERQLGLTLNANLLMSPSKSVTALFGLRRKG